jgi:MoxR-like ATPase
MSFEPGKIKKEHVLAAVEKIKQENLNLKSSTKYDVVIGGKVYPPKEIMRHAHEEMNGEHLWEYGGGEQTNKFLKKMGFEIVIKDSQPVPEKNIESTTKLLLNRIKELFPKFQGFNDSRFIDKEISYKQHFIRDAQDKLSKEKLQQYLDQDDYKQFYNEVVRIGRHKDNNLLYRGTPSSGDLALLHDETLDYSSFAKSFFELLHGEGTGAERLNDFSLWADEHGLPNKWTFVTYYLFVLNPDLELFVKPTEIKRFLVMLGKGDQWHHRPTGKLYQLIKNDLRAVGDTLPYKISRGFLDLQSFLWSALSAKSNLFSKAKQYLMKFAEEADTHFTEQTAFLEPRYQYFQDFFKKENLKQADWSDFQEMGKKIHALATNNLAYKNAFGEPNHNIERYRKAFLYLAYGDDSIATRIDAMLDKESEYHLKYLAESFYGELVGYLFSDKYVFFNRRDREAVEFLKLDISKKRGESFGNFYVRYNEEIKPLIDLYEEIVGRQTQTTLPLELDQFFSWLYENHLPTGNGMPENGEDDVTKKGNNYWVFQGNPVKYDFIEALKNNAINSWTIKAHKNEINPGDKVILWKTGSDAGCYALAEIEEKPVMMTESEEKLAFYKEETDKEPELRSKLRIVHNLVHEPILKEEIEEIDGLEELKVGIQGTNFTATKDEFEIIKQYAEEKLNQEREYWLYSPGRSAEFWDEFFEEEIMAIGWDYLGDLRRYQNKPEIQIQHQKHQDTESSKKNDTTACWEFVSGLDIGDVIIAKSGLSKLLGYGIVASDYFYDDSRVFYKHVRKVDWKMKGDYPIDHNLVLKTLTNISGYPTEHPDYKYYHERLLGDIGVSIEDLSSATYVQVKKSSPLHTYSMSAALEDIFLDEKEIENVLNLLSYKKNIILQGPPGTGKTYLAQRLAWLMMGVKDPNRIEMIQFHPSYSYEDFIRGYRPTESHFELKDGIFMKMCNKAKSDPDNSYFLIIDEINRGNLSKIFGELMMLIEKDKRGKGYTVSLPYQKNNYEPDFYIPENLFLIGTMNTADRSLAMVDYALRRRFVFINMMPNFAERFQEHLHEQGIDEHLINIVVERMGSLNEKISGETGLGKDFQIGHSYFCHTKNGDEEWFKNIIKYEIIPLLKEYWFDKTKKVDEIEEELLTL